MNSAARDSNHPAAAAPLDSWRRNDVLIVFALSITARVLCTVWSGLGNDDGQCLGIALQSDWQTMFSEIQKDGNPPLFYYVLRLWTMVFGTSDLAVKALPFLFSSLIPPASYIVFARITKERMLALITAILLCLCPPLIINCSLIRPYGLTALLGLLATDQLYQLLFASPSKWWIARYASLATLIAYTHPYGLMVLCGHAIAINYAWWRMWCRSKQIIYFSIAGFIALAVFLLLWMPALAASGVDAAKMWQTPINIVDIVPYAVYHSVNFVSTSGFGIAQVWLTDALIAIAYAGLVVCTFRLEDDKRRRIAIILLIIVGCLLWYTALTLRVPFIRSRYLPPLTPFILLIIVAFFQICLRKLPTAAVLAAPFVVLLPMWVPQLIYLHNVPFSPSAAATATLLPRIAADKDTLVCAFGPGCPELGRRLPQQLKVVAFPDLDRIQFMRWNGLNDRMLDPQNYIVAERLMYETLNAGGSVWLAHLPLPEPLPELRVRRNEDQRTAETAAAGTLLTWLQNNATARGQAIFPAIENTLIVEKFSPPLKRQIFVKLLPRLDETLMRSPY